VPEAWLAPIPPGLSFEQAAALPLVAVTAWQVQLYSRGRVGALLVMNCWLAAPSVAFPGCGLWDGRGLLTQAPCCRNDPALALTSGSALLGMTGWGALRLLCPRRTITSQHVAAVPRGGFQRVLAPPVGA
jgi:hypothetical protein